MEPNFHKGFDEGCREDAMCGRTSTQESGLDPACAHCPVNARTIARRTGRSFRLRPRLRRTPKLDERRLVLTGLLNLAHRQNWSTSCPNQVTPPKNDRVGCVSVSR